MSRSEIVQGDDLYGTDRGFGSEGAFHSIVEEKIGEGELWLNLCRTELNHVCGVPKMIRKMNAELDFLKKLRASEERPKWERVYSSNLSHLIAIVDVARTAENVVSILQPFHFSHPANGPKAARAIVDVVGDGGRTWIKVVARNGDAVNLVCKGEGQFGERSIVDRVKMLIACARQNEIFYRPPSVSVHFYNGVAEEVASKLMAEGVSVKSECRAERSTESIRSTSAEDGDSSGSLPSAFRDRAVVLNLDVSTMLAYVSSITNGEANRPFREPVLAEQAAREGVVAVKPWLDSLFRDRELICCATARADFQSILDKVGGEKERRRGELLLTRVTVVPDRSCSELEKLQIGGKIKTRSLVIFGTGLSSRAATVTANAGFVRAARSRGISFPAFVHESRALGENKSISPFDVAPASRPRFNSKS